MLSLIALSVMDTIIRYISGDSKVAVGLIAAAATIFVAIIGGLGAYLMAERARRREIYGQAFRAAMSWGEFYFRVRRRGSEKGEDAKLLQLFHGKQEEIDYYRGWIGSESRWMKKSYARFVGGIKGNCSKKIQEAWDEKPVPPGNFKGEDLGLEGYAASFLYDVRCHLSWWLVPRILVVVRNTDWIRRWF
jgi:hypothetical protein